MCAALAYLPTEHIDNGWLSIQEDSPRTEKLEEFYDYFVDQWLENSRIGINVWNCYKRRHRTNNVVEGWNNKLNRLLGRTHPNLGELIMCLRKEAEQNDLLYDRTELHLEAKRRKQTYVKLDRRIFSILEEYEHSLDIKKCLRSLAYVQKLQ